MELDNRIEQFVLETQRALFETARFELQMPLKNIAADSGIPYPTLISYSSGVHAMPLAAVKRLLRVEGMAPLLSRLFEPEGHALMVPDARGLELTAAEAAALRSVAARIEP